ncbi:MAG: hypothetical protein NT001_00940, partial [Candidatus Woesearchaeota archaeon]|nr:hypothetical protein [Candidatus Woesearchaeota archaeon]
MKNNKTAKKGSYKETKSAPNLEETVINDPYGILAGMFGRKYEEYRKRWKETGERKYVTGFPVHVDVDLSDSCNLSCRYCLQCTKQGWSNKYMSMPAFKKIVKESDEEKLCSMNIGWNTEPLMDVSLFKKALD